MPRWMVATMTDWQMPQTPLIPTSDVGKILGRSSTPSKLAQFGGQLYLCSYLSGGLLSKTLEYSYDFTRGGVYGTRFHQHMH